MAYELFFRDEGCALGLRVPRADWELISITSPENNPGIERYLGKQSRWHHAESGKLGYGGCAVIEKTTDSVEVVMTLRARNVRDSMLTLSFVLGDLSRCARARAKSGADLCELNVGCNFEHQTIFGYASDEFKKGVALLEQSDLDKVSGNMHATWKAVAPRNLKRCADQCYARVRDGRFELGCFGDACDLSVYPDSDPMFSCHNLDTPFQQATLLAGLASICGVAKRKV